MVLPRDAPRTGGDVELFPRGRRHGAPADRPARLGHGCVVVFGVFGERGVFGRAERGERGGGAETGGWERVSGASNGGRRPSAPGFPRRGEGRREVVAETAFVCVNSMRIIERNSPLLDATRCARRTSRRWTSRRRRFEGDDEADGARRRRRRSRRRRSRRRRRRRRARR